MSDTERLALPLLASAQAQKHVTHNEALARLDALVQAVAETRGLGTPPASPAEGKCWIVGAGATGAWAGKTGRIAQRSGGGWVFHTASTGWLIYVVDESRFLLRAGGGWRDLTDEAVLLKDGDSRRLRINKEAPADTASLLLQTGWSGRAEIGLAGDDNVKLKVSADGSAWTEVFSADRTTGLMTLSAGLAITASGVSRRVAPLTGHFQRLSADGPCLIRTGAGTVSILAGTEIAVGDTLVIVPADTAVVMPALTAGTDYAVYACADGSLRADASVSAPAGYTTGNSRRIGGFHYAPGGNAAAQAGGDTTPQINPYSIWDLHWRPACPDPRGMALVAGAFWVDIYLCGVDAATLGTSRHGVTIADGNSPPKIPAQFGGNGSTTYGSFTWFEAAELLAAAGKRMLSYAEFMAAAYGVTEAVSRGNDPVATGLGTNNTGSSNTDDKLTSRWGIIQAAGAQWVWGADLISKVGGADYAAATTFGWLANTEARGSLYLPGTEGIAAALLGAAWSHGTNAGSRASNWGSVPWNSSSSVGVRGRADHRRQI